MCTADQLAQKQVSAFRMAAFDAQSPEMRQALANAPYGIPHQPGMNARGLKHLISQLMEQRDISGVGPVPTEYQRRKRVRRRW